MVCHKHLEGWIKMSKYESCACPGEPISSRWTPAIKTEIKQSRVGVTRQLVVRFCCLPFDLPYTVSGMSFLFVTVLLLVWKSCVSSILNGLARTGSHQCCTRGEEAQGPHQHLSNR